MRNTELCEHCGMNIPVLGTVCPYCRRKRSPTDPFVAQIVMFICVPAVFAVIGGAIGDQAGMAVGAVLGGALVVAAKAFMKP